MNQIVVKGLINLRIVVVTNQNLTDIIIFNQLFVDNNDITNEIETEKENVSQSEHVIVEHESDEDV